MRKFAFVVVLGLALLRPSVAAADTLTMTGLGKGGWITVQMGTTTETGWAGEINWLLGSNPIFSYCVDLFDNATSPQQVSVGNTNGLTNQTDPFTTDGAGGRAAWLFNQYADGINGALGTNLQAAALQIAIWKTIYADKAFTILSSPSGAVSLADSYLANMGNQTSVAGYLNAQIGQDQITKTVPEPSTILLSGLGILGLALLKRNRSTAAQPYQMSA